MKRSWRIICVIVILIFIYQIAFANGTYQIDKPIYQDERYIFLKTDDSLLIFKKWKPLWYIFPFNENITTIKHLKKSSFLIDDNEVFFSDFKSLLLYKKTKKTIHGKKIGDFKINVSFDLVKKDYWTIQVLDNNSLLSKII